MSLKSRTLLGRYEIGAPLGADGMGEAAPFNHVSGVGVSILKLAVTCLVSPRTGQHKSGFANIHKTGAAQIGSRLRFRPDDPYYRLSDRESG
jgi:hypothetical protein